MHPIRKYLNSRIMFLFFLLLIIGLTIIYIFNYSINSSIEIEPTKRSLWAFLNAISSIPKLSIIVYLTSLLFSFSHMLRKSSYIKQTSNLPVAELFSTSMIISLFISFLVFVSSNIINPSISSKIEAIEKFPITVYKSIKEGRTIKTERKIIPKYSSMVFKVNKIPSKKELQKAIDMYYEGKYIKASKLLKSFLRDFPDNQIARDYLRNAIREETRKNALKRKYKRETDIFNKGYTKYKLGQYYRAMSDFLLVLRFNPRHKRAKHYLKLARKQLNIKAIVLPGKMKGLNTKITFAMQKALKLYSEKNYWASYRIVREILLLDEYNKTAKKYLKLLTREIQNFDFFREEFIDLYYYPTRTGILLPGGKDKYIFIEYLTKKHGTLYFRKVWIIEYLSDFKRLKHIFYSEFAKWVNNKIVLRNVYKYNFTQRKTWNFKKIHRLPLIIPFNEKDLWDISGFFYSKIKLSLFRLIDLVPLFEKLNLPKIGIKLSILHHLALPLISFFLSLFAISFGWRHRAVLNTQSKVKLFIFFLIVPWIGYFFLQMFLRLFMSIQYIAISSGYLIWQYLIPLFAGILMISSGMLFLSKQKNEPQ